MGSGVSAWAADSWGASWSGAWGPIDGAPAPAPEQTIDTSGDEFTSFRDDELIEIGVALVASGILEA